MTSLDEQFSQHCKKFFNDKILDLIADITFGKTFSSKSELIECLGATISKATPKKKKSPNKEEQLWLTLDEFIKLYKSKIICSYAPIRGQNIKNRFCAVEMTEAELEKVNGDRLELRCSICSTGKRKAGCGRKLIEKLSGQQIQTTTIGGVNVPKQSGVKELMGFISGNTEVDLKSAKTELVVKNFDGLKTEQTEDFTDFGSDFEKTNFNWVVRCKDASKTVIGKMPEDLVAGYSFPSDYESKLVELTQEEIEYCMHTFDLEYNFIKNTLIDEIEESDDEDNDEHNDAGILNALKVTGN